MWPVAGLTKADLLEYYVRIAPVLLPHVAGRPLRVARFPEGVHLRGVIDNELPNAPAWMRTRGGGVVIEDLATLLWVINNAAIELHVPLGPDRELPTCVMLELEAGAGR